MNLNRAFMTLPVKPSPRVADSAKGLLSIPVSLW